MVFGAAVLMGCRHKQRLVTHHGLVIDTIRSSHWPNFRLTLDRVSGFDTVHLHGTIYYIIEGDLLVTAEQLNDRLAKDSARQKIVADTTRKQPKHLFEQQTIIEFNTITLDTVKWTKFPIRFCIDKHSFATQAGGYDKVSASMRQAALDWQAMCGVKIVYVEALDDQVGIAAGADVDFVVSYKNFDNSGYVATSFFPEDPVSKRVLLVYPSYWTTAYDQVGVFRHEFGHIFGFRHEETANSPAVPTFCKQTPSPNQTSVGVSYDRVSVMHYYCGGNGTRSLDFSANDKLTFPLIYPKSN
ncbi:MAG: hypothetical protein JWR02_984 [Mucilaginibacter sp.]|nr:hypothetical protein [Mucilaginibacter sp.]